MNTKPKGTKNNRFQWTIARKIGGLTTVLILFILILQLYSIVTLRGLQTELEEVATLDVPLTELINQVEIQQLELQISMDQLIQLSKRTANDKNKLKIQETKRRLDEHSAALDQRIKAGIQLSKIGFQTESKSIFKEIEISFLDLQREVKHLYPSLIGIVETIESGLYPDDQTIDDVLSKGTMFDKKIVTLIKTIETFTEKEISIMERHEQLFFLVNTSLGISGILLGIILSLIVIYGIRTNLFRLEQRVTEVTQAIVENRSISASSIDVDSSDEIGKLANKLSIMFNNVSEDVQKRDELARHLKKVATTDQLTGAFNRLKWEENQELEIERVKRSHDELSVILFDIDFFKKVNDTFGHDVGDLVLIEVVQVAEKQIRKADSLYRTGGEEFIILTLNTSQEQAAILANKVRNAIANHHFEKVGQVTVSMGCAQFDKKNDMEAAQMLKRADEAQYRAKENGRNQVCIADEA